MADREQAGEARQQHQPEPDDAVDQHEGQLRQPVLGKQPRRGEQHEQQHAVPEAMARVLRERDVLVVRGLEQEPHTFFLRFSPNKPLGFTISIRSTTM